MANVSNITEVSSVNVILDMVEKIAALVCNASYISMLELLYCFGTYVDYCALQPCLNNGDCIRLENSSACSCVASFVGTFCETCKTLPLLC